MLTSVMSTIKKIKELGFRIFILAFVFIHLLSTAAQVFRMPSTACRWGDMKSTQNNSKCNCAWWIRCWVKKGKEATSILDVGFRDDVMEIPLLSIEDSTAPKFWNLMAFGQCCPTPGSHFTSYASFLDNLIDTPRDVVIPSTQSFPITNGQSSLGPLHFGEDHYKQGVGCC